MYVVVLQSTSCMLGKRLWLKKKVHPLFCLLEKMTAEVFSFVKKTTVLN